MTCIVGLKYPEKGVVVVGCDSRRSMSSGVSLTLPESAAKIFKSSGFVVGHSGQGRTRNITSQLQIQFGNEGPKPQFNLEQEIIDAIGPALRGLAKKGGYLHEKEGVIDLGGTDVLVAFGNQLCIIGNDFCVTPVDGEFVAIGSGQKYALGSLRTSEGLIADPYDRVRKALEAAAEFDNAVGPPFVLMETSPLPK